MSLTTEKHEKLGKRPHWSFIYDADDTAVEWGSRLEVYPDIYRSIAAWSGVFKIGDVECSFANTDHVFKDVSTPEGKRCVIRAGFADSGGTFLGTAFDGFIESTGQAGEVFTVGLVDQRADLLGSYFRHDLEPVGEISRWPHSNECWLDGVTATAFVGTADALLACVPGSGTYYPQTANYTDKYYRVATCYDSGGTMVVQFKEDVLERDTYLAKRVDCVFSGNPGTVADRIMTGTNGLSLAAAKLDADLFGTSRAATAGVTVEHTFSGNVLPQRTIGQHLQKLCAETNADFFVTNAGSYAYLAYYPPYIPTGLGTYGTDEFAVGEFELTRNLDTLWNAVVYDMSRVEEYQKLPENRQRYGTEDGNSVTAYGKRREKKIDAEWLDTHLGARVMAQRFLLLNGTVGEEVSFPAPLYAIEQQVGDLIQVYNPDVGWDSWKYCLVTGIQFQGHGNRIHIDALNVDALYSSDRNWQFLRTGATDVTYGTFAAAAADCACVF